MSDDENYEHESGLPRDPEREERDRKAKEASPVKTGYAANYCYPTLCSLVDREAASAIESLARYVRPEGDWVLVRDDLDAIDRALGEVEAILAHKWCGQSWSAR